MPVSRRQVLAGCGAGLAALAGCLSDEPSTEGTWPRRQVDNANTGTVDADGPTESLYSFWERARPGWWRASPVVGDGTVYQVYSQLHDGYGSPGVTTLEAFDAESGEPQWTVELFRVDESNRSAVAGYHTDSLVSDGDRVFVQTRAGLQTVGTDGEIEWTVPNVGEDLFHGETTPPIVRDDVVVTATHGTTSGDEPEAVFGVDPESGDELWRTEFHEPPQPTFLSAAEGVVYVTGRDGLVALDLSDGEELWRRSLPIRGPTTVVDGTLVVGFRFSVEESRIAALDAASGDELWRESIEGRWPEAGFTIADDRIYHVAGLGVDARRLDTGERVWRIGGADDDPRIVDPQRTPSVAGDALYVLGTERGDGPDMLFVVDRETGEELAAQALDHRTGSLSVPAVTPGLVYVASAGSITAIGECYSTFRGRCIDT